MLHSYKSKFNVQEIKVQLTHYFKNIFFGIAPDRSQRPGCHLQTFFTGSHLDTGEPVRIRVTYVETEQWSKRKFHSFRVEIWSTRGYWLAL